MTAIALDRLDRDQRAIVPHKAPTPAASRRTFANLVEDVEQPPAKPPHDEATTSASDGSSGVPSDIATEVSVVMMMNHPNPSPTELLATISTPPLAQLQAPELDLDELTLEVEPQGTDVLPLPIDGEVSDGVPVAIEPGPRPRARKPSDEATLAGGVAFPIPLGVRELMHARTEVALPIVTEGSNKPIQLFDSMSALSALPALPALAAVAAPGTPITQPPLTPLTPLEQAVHDLIANFDHHDERDEPAIDAPVHLLPEVKLLSVEYPDAPAPVAPVAEPELPAAQANPSHVHLVIDDGAERVVVTVAVRGSEVNVALRGQDDATTAALARNAGSLDHMMRARGLDLASLMTQRDPDSRSDRDHRDRDRKPDEKFSLEELA